MSVLDIYLRIIVEFLGEFLLFTALTSHKLTPRRHFVLRLIFGLIIIFGAGFGVSYLYQMIGETVWGRTLIYLTLFILATLILWACFDEAFVASLFCTSLSYAAQNFTYKLFLIFWVLVQNFGWDSGWGANYELFYRIIYYTFYLAAVAGVYYLFIRKLVTRISDNEYNLGVLTLSLIVLVVTIVLCSVEDIYFAKLSTVKENLFDNTNFIVLRETGNIFSLASLALVMYLFSTMVENRKLKQEIDYLQHTIDQGEWQYEMRKDVLEMVNMRVHDIKYRINAILAENGKISDRELNDVQNSVFIYDSHVDTGNRILNVLISEKRLFCEQNGIKFSCMVDGNELSFMNDGDLYTLFGNILDNALFAVKALKDPNKRVINLSVKKKNNLVTLQEENYFNGDLTIKNGLPETNKQDKLNHGFGVKSIRMIARKYEGEISVYTTGDVFHFNVIFSTN